MIDRSVILAIVYVLGVIALVLVGGIVYTSVTGKTIDAGVSALAGSVIGYLGGILTNVSRSSGGVSFPDETIKRMDVAFKNTTPPVPLILLIGTLLLLTGCETNPQNGRKTLNIEKTVGVIDAITSALVAEPSAAPSEPYESEP